MSRIAMTRIPNVDSTIRLAIHRLLKNALGRHQTTKGIGPIGFHDVVFNWEGIICNYEIGNRVGFCVGRKRCG